MGALLGLLLGAASLAGAAPLFEARVRVFQPVCSQARRADVAQAVSAASGLLEAGCGVRLSLTAWAELPLEGEWCRLPADPARRAARLKALAAQAKAQAHGAGDLALFLLPSAADERLSWALVDVSLRSACDSPQERRYLGRFGSLFFTDLAWMQPTGAARGGPGGAALLVGHEALHALTQRGHPSHAAPGHLLADHLADLGPAVDAELCACARRSPYLKPARRKP